MKTNFENGIFTLELISHIDSNNAPEVEAEITALRKENPDGAMVLDADVLEYISSAGLRIILRLLKSEKGLKMINVSPAVYEILDTTGFTDMMSVEKAYRRVSVEGCEVIGKGANGTVYRLDDETIIKTYHDASALEDMHREREIARRAFILGIPTAIPYDIVRVGESYGAVFELLKAKSITKLIRANPDGMEEYLKIYVDLLKTIHSTQANPGDLPQIKNTVLGWASFLKGYIPDDEQKKLYDMIEAIPETNNVIHGDYHMNNVMVFNGEPLLIDMDTVSVGHPIFELASMYNACKGYSACDHEESMRFYGLEHDFVGKIWDYSLRLYLDSEDESFVESVENKIKLIGLTRVLRRTIRRESESEKGKKLIAYCKEQISDLLKKVDSLVF